MPTILETLQEQRGVITTAQLASAAAGRAELRRWTRKLQRLTHGVYGAPDNDDPLLLHRAVLLGMPWVVFRGRTALALHAVPFADPPERLQVYVDQPCDASDRPELEVRRTSLANLDRSDVHGLPVVSSAQAGVDLARELGRYDAMAVLDSVIRVVATRDELRSRLVAGSRHVRRVRELVELANPLAESPAESWVRLILHDAGLPAPELQHVVTSAGHFVARLDMAWPDVKLYLEYDGRAAHSTDTAFVRDRRRQNELLGLGWVCLRVTAADLRSPRALASMVAREISRLAAA